MHNATVMTQNVKPTNQVTNKSFTRRKAWVAVTAGSAMFWAAVALAVHFA